MNPGNFHTHTAFCDGRDTPEELCREAVRRGFRALGFSGHSYTAFDGFGMDEGAEKAYREEVLRLRAVYAGRLEVYLGIEQDFYSEKPAEGYDYVIGSVHYVKKDGEYLPVDLSRKETERIIRECFSGDPYAFAESYYEAEAKVSAATGAEIVGHFDLIRKYNAGGDLFSEEHPRYRRAALDALDALCETHPVFEINTGAMARGLQSAPYPSLWILRELFRRGAPIMLSSDCHDRKKLDYGFPAAAALAREAGYRSRIVISGGKLEEYPI